MYSKKHSYSKKFKSLQYKVNKICSFFRFCSPPLHTSHTVLYSAVCRLHPSRFGVTLWLRRSSDWGFERIQRGRCSAGPFAIQGQRPLTCSGVNSNSCLMLSSEVCLHTLALCCQTWLSCLLPSCVKDYSICGEHITRNCPDDVDTNEYIGSIFFSRSPEQKCLSLWRDEDVQAERETRDQSVRNQ